MQIVNSFSKKYFIRATSAGRCGLTEEVDESLCTAKWQREKLVESGKIRKHFPL